MSSKPTITAESSADRTLPARLRRGLAVLGLLVLVALVVPFVVFAVPQVMGADHGFVILSGSMEPAISPGDVVIVDASAPARVDDVVTFDDGNEVPTTHRVVDVVDGQYVTKGDANENVDGGGVPAEAVLGRVVLTIPLIGHVILWVNTPLGYVSLVLVPIGLLLLSELYAWVRAEDDGDEAAPTKPTPAIRRVGAAASAERADVPVTAAESPAQSAPRSGVAMPDLLLTTVASTVLVGYAAWSLYTELAVVGAPSPITVAALTCGTFGLLAGLAMTVSLRLAARRPRSAEIREESEPSPGLARSDGGTSERADR